MCRVLVFSLSVPVQLRAVGALRCRTSSVAPSPSRWHSDCVLLSSTISRPPVCRDLALLPLACLRLNARGPPSGFLLVEGVALVLLSLGYVGPVQISDAPECVITWRFYPCCGLRLAVRPLGFRLSRKW